MLGVAWTVTNSCIHQSQQRHRCRKSGSASIICCQWWKKSPQKATSRAKAEDIGQSIQKRGEKARKAGSHDFCWPPTRLCPLLKLLSGYFATEHQTPLATRHAALQLVLLASSTNTWESCGHTLRTAAGNVWLWYVWAVRELMEIPPVPTALPSNWPLTGTT